MSTVLYPFHFKELLEQIKNKGYTLILAHPERYHYLSTMQEYEELKVSIATLKDGNIYERAWFMFIPSRVERLTKVYENFKPSIPLSLQDIGFSLLTALILSLCLMSPFRWLATRSERHRKNLYELR